MRIKSLENVSGHPIKVHLINGTVLELPAKAKLVHSDITEVDSLSGKVHIVEDLTEVNQATGKQILHG